MSLKKVRIDRWDAALPEALRWRAYEAFARCRHAGFLAWCAKEIPETSVPSRTALYAWAKTMRSQEQAHRLCNARQAQAEAGQIAEAGGVADETLAAALKALASDIVLRTGNVADATALIKSAVALRESGTKAEALALARAKFEFDAAKAALGELERLREIAGDRGLDEDEKLAAVRAALFGRDAPR